MAFFAARACEFSQILDNPIAFCAQLFVESITQEVRSAKSKLVLLSKSQKMTAAKAARIENQLVRTLVVPTIPTVPLETG